MFPIGKESKNTNPPPRNRLNQKERKRLTPLRANVNMRRYTPNVGSTRR